jgi:hypothetical protein
MLEQLPDHPRLVAVQASAEPKVGAPTLLVDRCEAMLVKEAIHHVTTGVRSLVDWRDCWLLAVVFLS